MVFTKLNKIGKVKSFLPTKQLKVIQSGKDYLKNHLKFVNTRYGKSLVAEIDEEYVVFLLKRIATALEADMDDSQLWSLLMENTSNTSSFSVVLRTIYNSNNILNHKKK